MHSTAVDQRNATTYNVRRLGPAEDDADYCRNHWRNVARRKLLEHSDGQKAKTLRTHRIGR